jgi:SAM-dependent methyltransferase
LDADIDQLNVSLFL